MILEPSLPRVVKHQFNGQDAPITRVKFSPDGSYLATSSSGDAVYIWRVQRLAENAPTLEFCSALTQCTGGAVVSFAWSQGDGTNWLLAVARLTSLTVYNLNNSMIPHGERHVPISKLSEQHDVLTAVDVCFIPPTNTEVVIVGTQKGRIVANMFGGSISNTSGDITTSVEVKAHSGIVSSVQLVPPTDVPAGNPNGEVRAITASVDGIARYMSVRAGGMLRLTPLEAIVPLRNPAITDTCVTPTGAFLIVHTIEGQAHLYTRRGNPLWNELHFTINTRSDADPVPANAPAHFLPIRYARFARGNDRASYVVAPDPAGRVIFTAAVQRDDPDTLTMGASGTGPDASPFPHPVLVLDVWGDGQGVAIVVAADPFDQKNQMIVYRVAAKPGILAR